MDFNFPLYDDHKEGHTTVTAPQLALMYIWAGALVLWIWQQSNRKPQQPEAEENRYTQNDSSQSNGSKVTDTVDETKENLQNDNREQDSTTGSATDPEANIGNGGNKSCDDDRQGSGVRQMSSVRQFTAVKPPPDLQSFLVSLLQLGFIMFFFFLSDYVKVFWKEDRVYVRDTFLFLVFLLFLVGAGFTMKKCPDKILGRDQTEEWKGWMQVMFVWYHYFAAAEWYNWIRIYIAAYVWMTGFGNFSFFWIRKDYSIWRSLKMLFRLNFLVLVLCAVVSNPYMLYYICPMHTYWFLSVYAFMGIGRSWNDSRWLMALKFALYAVVNIVVFEIPGLALSLFRPFWFFLGFNDGKSDIMHEWVFRLRLDHWACFIGMLCAYNYPHFESFIQKLEEQSRATGNRKRELLLKAATCVPWIAAFVIWHQTLLSLDKYSYNPLHPYFSFVPIITFILVRNLFPLLRSYYINMFAWLGKITLETYLSQLHVYLQSNAKHRLLYIPDYPLLNFSLNTVLYLAISHSLFTLTSDLSAYLLPKDTKLLRRNILYAILVLLTAFALGFMTKYAAVLAY